MPTVNNTFRACIQYLNELPTASRVASLASAVMALFAFALVFSFISFVSSLDPTTDLTIYFMAAEAVHNGENPYAFTTTTTYPGVGTVRWGYLYPPLVANILSPLVPLGFSAVHLCWSVVTAGAMLVTAWVLHRGRAAESSKFGISWFVIGISFWPIAIDGFERGQINAIVLGVLALVLYGLRYNRHHLVGLGIALAVQIKVLPVLFVVLLLDYRMVKARTAFIFGSLCMMFCLAIFFGVEVWQQFLTSALSTAGGGPAWISPENLAISHLFCLVFPNLNPSGAIWLQRGIVTLGIASIVRPILWRQHYDKEQVFGQLTLLMFLASPIVWYHHAVWLIFPIVWCWNNRQDFTSRLLLVVVVLCMTGYRFAELILCAQVGWSPNILIVEPMVFAASLLSLWILMRKEAETGTRLVGERA